MLQDLSTAIEVTSPESLSLEKIGNNLLEYNFLKLNTNNGAHEESSELNSVVDPDPYLICGSGSIHINI